MKLKLIYGGIICLVLLLVVAGCSQPATTVATPVPTAMETTAQPTAETTAAQISSTPGPTQTLPSVWGVEIQVRNNGEAIDPQVITEVRGGKGMNLITQIDITLTRSDGIVETGKMNQPLFVGKTVSLAGTTSNKDRAEVWAYTPQGDRIKIFDDYIPFRSY
ncbi:MAG: hypothetical protein WC391_02360 [Methanoregula sp.]|jgi:hypothetical protein